jgi:beta-glucosidase
LEAVVGTGVPVVLVLQNGRPLALPWAAKNVKAILEAWYPGEFGGQAIAETLFGDNNPAGRLSISFPKNIGQLPDFYNHFPSKGNNYVEGDGAPLYPFGFGLSYTRFKYSGLQTETPKAGSGDAVNVSCNVANTGSRAGDEVAELYVRKTTASVAMPIEALKGFTRVHLQPGETKRIQFPIPAADLAIWGADKKWAVEPGEYTVTVGGSSAGGLSTTCQIKQ